MALVAFLSLFATMFANTQAREPIIIDQDSGEILNGNFDAGWEAGWCAGHKHIKGDFALLPFAPCAPFPPLGRDNFQGGYNLGFLAGIAKACGR